MLVVTGGKGFIGSHLVRKLKKEGHSVEILDYKDSESTNLASYISTKQFFEEITDHKTKPVEAVFDLATLPLTQSLQLPYSTAYEIFCMGINLCELCREGYFKTLIHVSSSEVYGTAQETPMTINHPLEPRTPYAAAKAAQDMLIYSYIHSFKMDASIARPFNTYGPGQDLNAIIPATIKQILLGKKPIVSGDGEQKRDFIYVTDTVRGIYEVWQDKDTRGKVTHIARGEPMRIIDIVYMICDMMKYKGKIQYIKPRPGDVEEHFAKNYYFNAVVNIEEGLKRTIKWWKQRKDFM